MGSSEAADTCTLQSAIESAIREFDLRGIDFARGFLYNRNVTKAEVTKMNKPRDSHARAGEREEMGLRTGTMLTVIQRTNFGGRVVASGTQRIAIDGGTARSIFVAPAAGRDSQLAPQHDTADRQEA